MVAQRLTASGTGESGSPQAVARIGSELDEPATYTILVRPVAVNVWVARSYEGEAPEHGDDWVACCNVRAERWVLDDDLAVLHLGSPATTRKVAHLFAGEGRFPTETHRQFERLLVGMGFTHRYQERSLGDGRFMVLVVDLMTGKREVRIVSCENSNGSCAEAPGPVGPQTAQALGLDWEKIKEGARRLLPMAKTLAGLTANTYDDAFVAFVEALLTGQP